MNRPAYLAAMVLEGAGFVLLLGALFYLPTLLCLAIMGAPCR